MSATFISRTSDVVTTAHVVDALRARDLLELALEVCKTRGVLLQDLCGRTRAQSVARARHEAWWRIRNHPERYYSLFEIARLFERDPATVSVGVARHQQRLDRRAAP